MPNARDNLWEELKNICNKNYDLQGIQYWKYILKAKDYVPLKDLKEWIRKKKLNKLRIKKKKIRPIKKG